ncbi:MAG TPA: hypothetical protein VI759_09030 [Dehalococcoidia bacterium]|nr:hypothetical protein [Dehalococcoidia bacterium]
MRNFDHYRGDGEDFANEVSVREILQRDILIAAPQSLVEKINAALEEPDRLYREQTSEVDQPWFGRPHESHWWWYRCPEHWAWYRDHAPSA